MAERKGFEPLNGLTRYTISNFAKHFAAICMYRSIFLSIIDLKLPIARCFAASIVCSHLFSPISATPGLLL